MANAQALGKTGGRYGDLKRRLVFLVLALVVYRLGTHIPVPGINPDALADLFRQNQGGILGLFNMFSGGALSRFSIFALGIMPYISASIIMQLMSVVVPSLEALKKEGESGRRKITQYTRYGTVVLALVQAVGISVALESQQGLVIDPGMLFRFTTVVTLVTGTMFVMWLGEQITERGLGNGISILIFAGIVAGLPAALAALLDLVRTNSMSVLSALFIVALVVLVTAFVVFVERGQRKITVNYAKRQVGNKIYGGQSSHLPLKLNMAGVIPPIFASSIILFPATITSWFSSSENMRWLSDLAAALSPRQPLYITLYSVAIIFFCFFLHGSGVQQPRNGGQPEEEWCVCSGHPSGRTNGALHRQDPDAFDARRCHLHHVGVPVAGILGDALERSLLLRWYVSVDYCGGDDGFHGASPGLHDVSPVRLAAQEG